MQHHRMLAVVGAIALGTMFAAPAWAETMPVELEGFQEAPAISTTGQGQCRARIREGGDPSIAVELSYENLTGNVAQAHIHIAQPAVNGGIVLFLCTNLGNGPAGTQLCPGTTDGGVTVTLTAADVLPVTAQGIDAGEIDEVINAMREGKAYCNVHTNLFPGGEIRGQFE